MLPRDGEGGALYVRFLTLGVIDDLQGKAAPLGPAPVHPKEHSRPVLRVDPTRARGYGEYGVPTTSVVGWFSSQSGLAAALLPYADVVDLASSVREEDDGSERDYAERPQLEDREMERAKALGEFVAYRAAMHPRVQRFRMFILADIALTREALWELQDSPAERRGILAAHGAGISSGSLDTLEETGERVSEDFGRYWSPDEAVKFILADEVSWREPVSVRTDSLFGEPTNYGTVTLRAEPWLPSATVAKLYQHEQMRMLGHRPRALSLRNLLMVHFVFARLRTWWYSRLGQKIRLRWGPDYEFS